MVVTLKLGCEYHVLQIITHGSALSVLFDLFSFFASDTHTQNKMPEKEDGGNGLVTKRDRSTLKDRRCYSVRSAYLSPLPPPPHIIDGIIIIAAQRWFVSPRPTTVEPQMTKFCLLLLNPQPQLGLEEWILSHQHGSPPPVFHQMFSLLALLLDQQVRSE